VEFIRDAGFGIWPVLIFGLATLIAAARQALTPTTTRVITTVWLMALTLVAGALGTAVGVQTSGRALLQVAPDERWIFFIGLQEALNNLVAALVIAAVSLLLLLAGHLKGKPQPVNERSVRATRTDEESLQRATA
jgi:hypothetical protein